MCLKEKFGLRLVGALWVLLSSGVAQARETQPVPPVQVEYNQATDVFNVLDNLPDWLPGYTSAGYSEYWEAHLGLDEADRAALSAYGEFRRRTAPAAKDARPDPAGALDLFAPPHTREVDAFAQPFLDGDDLEAATAAAIAAQAPRDRAMLRAYFARFVPRTLRLLVTRSRFDKQRAALASQLALPGVPGLADEIRAFYGVGAVPGFHVRFVWWPDPERTQAKVRGRIILLQGPADDAGGTPMDWAPVVLHEYAHYVSAGQSIAQRQSLSADFLRACPSAAALPNPLNAFEEPLAIYWGQYRFEHEVRGHELSMDDAWYFRPMPDRIAKAIAIAFPATEPAPALDDALLLRVATAACLQEK